MSKRGQQEVVGTFKPPRLTEPPPPPPVSSGSRPNERTKVDTLLSALGEAIRELDQERKVVAYIVRDPNTGKEFAYMPEEVTIVREAKD